MRSPFGVTAIGLATFGIAWSGIAEAQVPATNAGCFLVANLFAKSSNEEVKSLAVQASFFYLGRLRGTSGEIETELGAAAKAISDETSGQLLQACLKAMNNRIQEVQAAGERLRNASNK